MRYSKSDRVSDHRKRLTTELIRRVQADEDEAILELLSIFESKIRYFSRMELFDKFGTPVVVYNEDYIRQLEDKLVHAFKKMRLPEKGKKHEGGRRKCRKNRK